MGSPTQKDPKDLIAKTEKIKEKMQDNIELLLERGKKLRQLEENSSERLLRNAQQLKKEAKELKFQARWNNIGLYAIGIGLLAGTGVGVIAGFTALTTIMCAAIGAGISYMGGWIYHKACNYFERTPAPPNHKQDSEPSLPPLKKEHSFTPSFRMLESKNDLPVPTTLPPDKEFSPNSPRLSA